MERANRQQVAMRLASLDELLPEDHRARVVWEMVAGYDLSGFYARIEALEGEAGRPAIDPQVLVALWLYATLEGVGSARQLDRLCQEHLAYQWLLGGVGVNYHTLADFRVDYEAELDQLLTGSVAALMREGLVDLEQTAQDGVRIRARAGASSFRRQETLEECLRKAQQQVEQLKHERDADAGQPPTPRQHSARQRQARERVERVKHALQEVQKIEAKKAKNRESKRKNRPARASTSDPEARVTKMPDGGFRPAFNGHLNVDMNSRIIVGVELSNEADPHLLEPMLDQTQARFGRLMKEHYIDGGIRSNAGITAAGQRGVTIYAPIPDSYNKKSLKKPAEVLPSDSPQVAEWKQRMVTEEAKEKYKGRAATVEWANALLRNRGLYRFLVRGVRKARSVLLWYVLAHNLVQALSLRQPSPMTAA
ncbi:MAG: IS1182 family transposase [Chloroflexi bacterium]|nr:MAG: IS1182 family transposase [Chloroflexota bacterium]